MKSKRPLVKIIEKSINRKLVARGLPFSVKNTREVWWVVTTQSHVVGQQVGELRINRAPPFSWARDTTDSYSFRPNEKGDEMQLTQGGYGYGGVRAVLDKIFLNYVQDHYPKEFAEASAIIHALTMPGRITSMPNVARN